jgi:hypothetical protein
MKVFSALFLFLFAIYLVTYTPRINSSDGLAMFATAESLVRRGALDIEQIRWMGLQQGTYGLDGLLYSRKGVGVPIALLPLTWLGFIVPWFGMVGASLLFNPVVTGLTAVLLLAYLQALGFSRRSGLIVALTFGLATLAWPYAKSLFSDPFSGLLLLATAYVLLKFDQVVAEQPEENYTPRKLCYPFLAGLFLGWNVATRYAEALFVPVFGVLLLYYLSRNLPKLILFPAYLHLFFLRFWPFLLTFVSPILLIGLGLIIFNLSRYGNAFNTGYLAEETFGGIWWDGIIGQLFSPGRGLFLYSPILLLSLWGIIPFFKRFRVETLAALAVIIIHLLLYGKWFMWHGGYAWGPRFMVPTLPFWSLFLAPVVAQAWPEPGKAGKGMTSISLVRFGYIALLILSLIPQILSVVVDFAPFQNWLLESGLPLFARETFFEPRYSPFLSAWGFINRVNLDLAWAWQGHITGWLLLVLLVNVLLTSLYLLRLSSTERPVFSSVQLLPYLSTAVAVFCLLWQTHHLPSASIRNVATLLDESVRPEDVIIFNDPELTAPLAERYKGHALVLGLNTGGVPLPNDIEARLEQVMKSHPQIWWLPNWLPLEESAVEQTLLAEGFRSRQENIEGQRVVVFAFPHHRAMDGRALETQFGKQILLKDASYPSTIRAGASLPVELYWQAKNPLQENYHVFIHLLNGASQVIAQADGQPVYWTRPTSTWRMDETIIDRHGLWLPPATPPGPYQLLIGLYLPKNGQRLLLVDGADAIKLSITLE